MTPWPMSTLCRASRVGKGIRSWGRRSERLTGTLSQGARKYPRNGCFWTSLSLSSPIRIYPLLHTSHRLLAAFTTLRHPVCSFSLLSSTLNWSLHGCPACNRIQRPAALCCGWLSRRSASYYTLSLFMQTCLCDNSAVYLLPLYSFHQTCPATQQLEIV